MGQQEVIDALEQSKVPLSAKEISIKVNERDKEVMRAIKVMLKYNEIEFIELPKELSMKFYNCKRRLKLYYLP